MLTSNDADGRPQTASHRVEPGSERLTLPLFPLAVLPTDPGETLRGEQ
jgi:hypothetical protein